jgi:antitoxin component of RelBE/YafQ-DinJ toxin-antitoxin module
LFHLLQVAQRAAIPFSQAVASAKRFAPQITDPNANGLLVKAANELADATQKLMQATKVQYFFIQNQIWRIHLIF